MARDSSVVVVSRDTLVRDAVRTALRAHGFAVTSLAVPVDATQFGEARRWTAQLSPTVGVYLAELDTPEHFHEAAAVVRRLDLVWLLLTAAPPGPSWVAMLDAGVRSILSEGVSLHRLSTEIHAIAAGEQTVWDKRFEDALAAYQRLGPRCQELLWRLQSLSPREMAVLVDLRSGLATEDIATHSGVTPGTVQTQVKAVLRKLGVRTRMEAISSYIEITGWLAPRASSLAE